MKKKKKYKIMTCKNTLPLLTEKKENVPFFSDKN